MDTGKLGTGFISVVQIQDTKEWQAEIQGTVRKRGVD